MKKLRVNMALLGATLLCAFNLSAQSGMNFDGVDDYVSAPNASALIAGSAAISLSFWVFPENNSSGWPDFDGFAGFRNNFDADFYVMQLDGSNVEARFRNSSGVNVDIAYAGLNINQWNHFVLTYDGAIMILYHNGVNVGNIAANGTITSTTTSLDMGMSFYSNTTSSFYLDGTLDNVALWSTALTPTEVTGMYTNTCTPDLSNPALKLCYEFNEGAIGANNTAITGAHDSKGAIDGDFVNMALNGATSNYAAGVLPSSTMATLNVNDCVSYTVPSGNNTYTVSGTYYDTIPNSYGCDSLITIHATIGGTSSTVAMNTCQPFTVPSGNNTYSVSGTYHDTIPNSLGCDSVITFLLTVNSPSAASITETACSSYTVPSGNNTYTSSGVYTDVIPNVAGCDSVLTIDLTITNPSSSTITETACDSYTVPSGNATYTASGTYTDIIPNASGCDSVITINLTISTVDNGMTLSGITLTATSTGSSYQWIDCGTNMPVSGATNQTFVPTSNGSYAVIVTTSGCSDTSACAVVSEVGLKELQWNNVVLYPNPVKDALTVELGDMFTDVAVTITDLSGKVVLNQGFKTTSELNISLENQKEGVYMLTVSADGLSRTLKVIKL